MEFRSLNLTCSTFENKRSHLAWFLRILKLNLSCRMVLRIEIATLWNSNFSRMLGNRKHSFYILLHRVCMYLQHVSAETSRCDTLEPELPIWHTLCSMPTACWICEPFCWTFPHILPPWRSAASCWCYSFLLHVLYVGR